MKIRYPYEFDKKKRSVAKSYRKGKLLFYFLSLLISLATSLVVLFSGFHISLRDFVSQYPLTVQVYGFLILLIFTFTGLPLAFYSTFIHDKKFKITVYKISGWLKDFLKSNLIYYTLSLIVISLLYFSIRNFSPWWIYAGIFYIIFSTTINYVYPLIIIPFMWKTEPYRDRTMKERILNLCRKLGVANIRNVVVIKESEKSVRSNAVFMGFGQSKRIGLFDNLLTKFTRNEIETVVGHELGHYVEKDLFRGMVLESILIFPALFLVDYFVSATGPIFGITSIASIASLPLIGLINGILGFLIMPITNTHSRWRESNADKFALIHLNKPEAQVSTEKRLADTTLSTLKANPFIEFWLFTHPSVDRRIKMAEEWKKNKG